VPSADTTVVSRLLSHGLSGSPGRHNQTVPGDSADGDAVVGGAAVVVGNAVVLGEAVADGDTVGDEDESSHEMPTTAVTLSAMPTRITRLARRHVLPPPKSKPDHRRRLRPIIGPTSLRTLFTA